MRRLTAADVRASLGDPEPPTSAKILDRLDRSSRVFLAHSPFLCLATSDSAGNCDCSPRGDHPGFVRALDDRTLAIPDRLGNRLADSFSNILDNGHVGLVCFVPGMSETLRINGTAYVTDDLPLRRMLEQDHVVPELATVVEIDQVYLHCGRALLRSRLWDPEMQDLADEVPSAGTMWAEASGYGAEVAREIDAASVDGYRTLY
ncbi:pyridoxamine 5'-phosphate oxidase family protein [Rathayibacter sp. VKM Ac-2803]|uniref:MSMEG_1061 family FMN-dependent PPOX-type flavoprotein n=1 Tax=unclassified Rathayibacter TaxID=2609250 RepID=UPI00135C8A5D|nr:MULTISPECIES: MSMEG_1061 family FMN-dependent PPOX-type flavoprotein [unclassified Rathayibacter]MWV48945.1 pyridoxamine 5'-phosphate oxidase family protein [Rathayibacter sp. VKM Ac-2803]MWV58562.1 pyridoxamine 5'-phosphate oxidase family protein [Rathayibacter sp. VKM Ac-2754]